MSLYTYNAGVPNAPDDPSQDQPDMLTNTQSIDGILSEDHVSFNNSNGGVHKQVRFSQNISAPDINPGWVSAIYSDVDPNLPGGLPWPFWRNSGGSELIVGPSSNVSQNGYIMIGAYMFQWGTDTTSGGGTVDVNFVPNFSDIPYVVELQVTGTSSNNPKLAYSSGIDKDKFTIKVTNGSSGIAEDVNWIAIGKR